jgi:hypothetical protein
MENWISVGETNATPPPEGEADSRFPLSIRPLSERLRVSRNIIAKAYAELES